jgi:hypothetical protein
LKLQVDESLSSFAFKFNFRRYIKALGVTSLSGFKQRYHANKQGLTLVQCSAQPEPFLHKLPPTRCLSTPEHRINTP